MTLLKIIAILILVESDGDNFAVNKTTGASGCLQIKEIMVDEVNRILAKQKSPVRYSYEDRFNRWKSVEMAKVYFNYWIPKRCDDFASLNDYLMAWHLGSGWKDKGESVDYINRFHVKKLEHGEWEKKNGKS